MLNTDVLHQRSKPAPVPTAGATVDASCRRPLDRARRQPGLPLTDESDLHLMVDGRRIGDARLPQTVFNGFSGRVELVLTLAARTRYVDAGERMAAA